MDVSFKRITKFLAIFLVAAVTIVTAGCKKYIYDDLAECHRGIYVNLFTKTDCMEEATYPKAKSADLFIFDDNKVLAMYKHFDNVKLAKDEELFVPITKPGTYTVVAWTDIDKNFISEKTTIGKTTYDDIYITLKDKNTKAQNLEGVRIYTGKTNEVIIGEEDEFFAHVGVNIREYTNRVDVRAAGFDKPEDYVIELSSNNGRYLFNGKISKNIPLQYPTEMKAVPNEKDSDKKDLFAHFTTMKLQTGYNNELVIKKKDDGKEIFRVDLIGAILLSNNAKNINMDCINDFNILVKVQKCNCPNGYMAVAIYVNNWLVHSYNIILG